MEVNILAFGIAKDILGNRQLRLEVPEEISIGELKEILVRSYPEFARLRSLLLAVNEEYAADDRRIGHRDQVVIIPPVSGG